MSDDNGFWTGVFVAGGLAVLIYACSERKEAHSPEPLVIPASEPTTAPTVSPSMSPMPPSPVVPPRPSHMYDAVEGRLYYYGKAVSEEDRKRGKNAPDMLAFRYLGRTEDGGDRVQFMENGRVVSTSTCSRPCKIIHYDDGSAVGFSESSIIGAVFLDAQRGFLKPYSPPAPKVTPVPSDEPWLRDPITTPAPSQ